MDDFDRSVSPSSSLSIKRSSLQSAVDENEENNHQMFVNMPKIPKKPNYMSSTISMSSKMITPKKKILSERNEASEPILDNAHESLCCQEPRSPQMVVPRFTPKEEFDSFEPYDPLTNFLSPRPQFLRYNPNRRLKIFGDRETGNEETEDGLISQSSSSSSSSSIGEICSLKEEEEINGTNEEIDESDKHEIEEEIGEEDVKVGYFCSGGMITFLFLLVLGLSELFLIYVNCSTSPWGMYFQEIDIESRYYGTGNDSLEAILVKNLQSEDSFWHQGVFESGNTLKEERDFEDIKGSDEIKISEDSDEMTEVDDSVKEVEPTISDIEEDSNGDSNEDGLKTDESLEYYAPKVFEGQQETEVNLVEEAIDTAETTTDEIISGNTAIVKTRNFLVNLMRVEAEFAIKILIGGVTFSTIVMYCFLGLKLKPKKKKKKNIPAKKESPPSKQPPMEDHTYEKYSFEKSLTTEKCNEVHSKSKAPSVELLSEFAVREINSSHPNRSEFSNMGSPPYGSFSNTAQLKTPKKLAGGEVSTEITPVRRSIRIRNLSIKSP